MRLTGLEVKNVKRVKAIRLALDGVGNVVRVRGENEAGKSSLFDAIRYLFAGAKSHPPKVIREGESEAEVIGETEELIATRRWWKDEHGVEKTELELRAKDGSPLKSPQAVLDKLFNDNAFVPEAYDELEPKKQLEVLRRLTGIDTTAMDREYETLFAQRRDVGRVSEAAEARLKGMPDKEPPAALDVGALLKERGECTGRQQLAANARAERDAAQRRVVDAQEAVKVAEQALAQAQARLDHRRKEAAAADNAVDEAEEAAEGVDQRISELGAAINTASQVAAERARWEERTRLVGEVERFRKDWEAKTTRLEELRLAKERMIAGAKFPIEGLGLDAEGVTYKGLPLSQASSAARLRVSVGIAVALNPKLRVMLIRQGSLLDKRALYELDAIAEERDLQVFVELVGEEGPATVVIRDGALVAVTP